jgi:hypothetical protein
MPTLAGISYVHSLKYFVKGIDEQGPYYDVEYHIDSWDDGDAFANALRGLGTDAPHRHPLSSNLICTSAVVSGRGRVALNTDGLPSYSDGAAIRATYRSGGTAFSGSITAIEFDDPFNVHQIDSSTPLIWCTQELDFEVETLSVPNTSYTWDSDSASANIPVQLDVHVTTMVLTFHRRSSLPMSTVRSLRGRINNATFLGATTGTVLFVGGKTSREASSDGTITQRVQLIFKERDQHWNKFLRPGKMPTDAASWDYLEDSSGNRRFTLADLSPLVSLP